MRIFRAKSKLIPANISEPINRVISTTDIHEGKLNHPKYSVRKTARVEKISIAKENMLKSIALTVMVSKCIDIALNP
jgi:hypothetical protein